MKNNRFKHSKLAALLITAGVLTAAGVATAQPLYWDGGTVNLTTNGDGLSQGGAGNWDNSTQNWDQGSGLPHTAWISGANAVFGGTGSNINVAATITANAITVSAANYVFTNNDLAINAITNASTVTFYDNIDNSAGLTKAGSGTAVIYSPSPELTGPINIAAGTLEVEGSTAKVPSSFGNVTIAANATFKINLTNTTASTATFSQNLSGPGAFYAGGASYNGQITLVGSSDFSGNVTVSSCTLAVTSINDNNPSALGMGTNVTIANNSGTAFLTYLGYGDTTSRTLTLGSTTLTGTLAASGYGPLVWNGPLAFATSTKAYQLNLQGTSTYDNIFGGVIADNNSYATTLLKNDAGTWMLTATNTFSGGTTINKGVLLVMNDNNLGASNAPITFIRSLNSNSDGALGSISNNVILGASRTIIATNHANFAVYDTNNLYVESYITSTGTVAKANSSYLMGCVRFSNDTNNYGDFSAAGGYTEFTSVADQGTPSALGQGTAATGGTIVLNGGSYGTLRYVGINKSATHRPLNLANTATGYALDVTNTGTIAYLSSASLVTVAGNKSLTLEGSNPGTNTLAQIINDNSGVTSLIKSGTGQWVLTGVNAFSGGATISGGVLTVSSDGNLGTVPASATPNILTINGGTLSASASFALNANRGIALGPTGTDALGNYAVGAGEMDVAAGQTLTYGGIMANNTSTNSGGLVKGGAGELVLSGVNTYSGNTTINAGTLALSGNGSIADSTNLVINGGADLDVSGVSGGYTLAASQTLWATNDATGTNNGSLNLGSAALALGYTNGIPALAVTGGAFTLNGNTVSVAVTNGGIPLEAGRYLLIAAAAGGTVAGALPASVSVSGDVDLTLNAALSIQSGQLYLVLSSPYTPTTNAYLASLRLSPALTFTPAFASNTLVYAATEAYGSSPTVTVVNADTTATNELITNGVPAGLLPSGAPSIPLALTLGQTNVVQVLVTAQDGLTTNLYTVNVVEQPSQTPPQLARSVSGNSLVLTWPQDHLGWRLLVQTNNLSRGISTNGSDWGTVAGSTAITSTNLAIVRTNLNEYYRLVYP